VSRNPYADILSLPGTAKFSAAGALARLPISMLAIGTVLMIQTYTGSYAAAGRVAGVLSVAQAVGSPLVARLVDRHGQRVVLLPMMFATLAGITGLVATAMLGAAEPWLWLCAIVAGAPSGSYGSYVRARWANAARDPRRLHTAFSLESSIDEVIFIVGPVIATVLATAVIPSGALIIGGAAGFLGSIVFLMQRATEPPPRVRADGAAHESGPPHSAILVPGMWAVALIFVAMGTVFGSVDVATVSFADEHGSKGSAGWLLAVLSLGSLISGLAYGLVHWKSKLSARFAIGAVAMAALETLLLIEHGWISLIVVMLVAGIAVSPTIVTGNGIVQAIVPPRLFTEGMAWVGTSIGAGAAAGVWLAGLRIDAMGARGGYQVAVAAAVCSAVIALAATPLLRKRESLGHLAEQQP
jgi:MFS family permease